MASRSLRRRGAGRKGSSLRRRCPLSQHDFDCLRRLSDRFLAEPFIRSVANSQPIRVTVLGVRRVADNGGDIGRRLVVAEQLDEDHDVRDDRAVRQEGNALRPMRCAGRRSSRRRRTAQPAARTGDSVVLDRLLWNRVAFASATGCVRKTFDFASDHIDGTEFNSGSHTCPRKRYTIQSASAGKRAGHVR